MGDETELIETNDLSPVSNSLQKMINYPTQLFREIVHDCNAQWHILYYVKVYDEFPDVVPKRNAYDETRKCVEMIRRYQRSVKTSLIWVEPP